MSKSDPNSAIFMEDSEGDVNVKIKKAYCPPQVRCMRGMRFVQEGISTSAVSPVLSKCESRMFGCCG